VKAALEANILGFHEGRSSRHKQRDEGRNDANDDKEDLEQPHPEGRSPDAIDGKVFEFAAVLFHEADQSEYSKHYLRGLPMQS
jgi:hypothetical protein